MMMMMIKGLPPLAELPPNMASEENYRDTWKPGQARVGIPAAGK